MFELSSLGVIFPSYDVETRVVDDAVSGGLVVYATLALGLGESSRAPVVSFASHCCADANVGEV